MYGTCFLQQEHLFIFTEVFIFNSSCFDPRRREKIKLNFTFTLVCGASKGFMKALKAFQKCTGREGLKSYLVLINPFSTNVSFLYPLKTENLRFFDVFRGYRNEILVEKELNYRSIFCY